MSEQQNQKQQPIVTPQITRAAQELDKVKTLLGFDPNTRGVEAGVAQDLLKEVIEEQVEKRRNEAKATITALVEEAQQIEEARRTFEAEVRKKMAEFDKTYRQRIDNLQKRTKKAQAVLADAPIEEIEEAEEEKEEGKS
jgi:hypothetical protein